MIQITARLPDTLGAELDAAALGRQSPRCTPKGLSIAGGSGDRPGSGTRSWFTGQQQHLVVWSKIGS